MSQAAYLLTRPKPIISHLALLVKASTLLTLHVDEKQSFLTTLLHIDGEKNLLIVDYGPDEALNQKLLALPAARFTGNYQGIEVAFSGAGFRVGRFREHRAFGMSIPETLYWRQRREFYRIRSPRSKRSYVLLNRLDQSPLKLPLLDLSLSGAAVFCPIEQDWEGLNQGAVLTDCELALAEQGEGLMTAKIANRQPINPKKPENGLRVGLQFLSLARGLEARIQRYIREVERELLQKFDS